MSPSTPASPGEMHPHSHAGPSTAPSGVGPPAESYVVLMPCLDDWDSVRTLISLLDVALFRADLGARILIVDDGSRETAPGDLAQTSLRAIARIDVLRLLRNVGHQRAICIGLCRVVADPEIRECAGIVVMDADGEDAPEDVPRLIERFQASHRAHAVFACRTRRSEGVTFRLFYWLYRRMHHLLTGLPVHIGNFSVLPLHFARRLTVVSELWNHYAAAAVHARLPIDGLPTPRADRLAGSSRMHLVALVSHGLGAMAVFADRIGVRALLAAVALMALLAIGMVAIVGIRFLTTLAIPGWATTAVGILAVLLMQSILLSLVFVFLIHLGRAGIGFLPARDYAWFVEQVTTLWRRDDRV